AASSLLSQLLSAIYRGLELDPDDLLADTARGFLLSVDAAHALHPNYPDKADPTNRPRLGGGLAIKQAASQSYAGDAAAQAIVAELCRQHDIPCQTFANRSSIPGGATLGAIAAANLVMRGQDVGVPLLAMHAARETMAAADQEALTRLVRAFFSD
ncbi:MAG: M18 family aminopeptidase, partial [Negativicutes bacterium]